jgi:hypothetical protein
MTDKSKQLDTSEAVLQQLLDFWKKEDPSHAGDKRTALAERLATILPHTSAALYRDPTTEELEEALRKDQWPEQIQRIATVQNQAALILNLLLEKSNPVSFINIGEVWKPSKEDFELAFIDGADEAFERYQQLWGSTPVPMPKEGQNQLLIQATSPALLFEARLFPSGYQRCEHRFNPECTWIAWKYVREGESSGMAYNGLVWLGDRFKWFPKPWKMWA